MARSLGFRSGDFAAVAFGRGPVRSESLTVPFVGDDIDEELHTECLCELGPGPFEQRVHGICVSLAWRGKVSRQTIFRARPLGSFRRR